MSTKSKVCSECGKSFIPAALHMYKVTKNGKVTHQCSYTCWNKAKPKSTGSRRDYAARKQP